MLGEWQVPIRLLWPITAHTSHHRITPSNTAQNNLLRIDLNADRFAAHQLPAGELAVAEHGGQVGAAGELQVQFAFQFAGFEAVHVAGQMIGFGVQWCAVGGQQVDPGGFDQGEHFSAEFQVEAFGTAVGDQCGKALGAAVQFEFYAVIQTLSLDVANPGQQLIARAGT